MALNPVGVQLGDHLLTWCLDGRVFRVPARVGALPLPGGETIGYLLAGDEIQENSIQIALPRRSGYRWGNEAISDILLRAFLARVRQDFPPGGRPPLRLAVPFWVQDETLLVRAAEAVGWGEVSVVTDMHVLAIYAGRQAGDSRHLLTLVPGDDLVDIGLWERAGDGWLPLAWESHVAADAPEVVQQLSRIEKDQPVPLFMAGDAVPALLESDFGPRLDALALPWTNLGWDGVVRSAAEVEAPDLPLAENLQLFLATDALPLRVPPPAPGETVWRALRGSGTAVTVRMVGRWGRETLPSLTLLETVLTCPTDPLLCQIRWESARNAEVSLQNTEGDELFTGRISLRGR